MGRAHTQEYVPTVFENTCKLVPCPTDPGKIIEWSLWDTAGQEEFDRIRPLSYQGVDVVVVVFAVNYRASLGNVQDKVSERAEERSDDGENPSSDRRERDYPERSENTSAAGEDSRAERAYQRRRRQPLRAKREYQRRRQGLPSEARISRAKRAYQRRRQGLPSAP